jgi:asparagine synthase (glutamine-hydrolysing)
MCGICGIIGAQVQNSVLHEMLSRLSHRGPDVQDIKLFPGGGFGHARLSVIDTDARSNQPMYSPDGRYVLVFNGEIYNFKELRFLLATEGEQFITSGDTEVLLRWLIRKGVNGLSQLRGMFAFGLFDILGQSLLLARDPFGKKPLYFHQSEGTFFFASEMRALLPVLKSRKLQHLEEFLNWQSMPAGSSIIEGIESLLPGSWLLLKNGSYQIGTFFSLESAFHQAVEQGPVSPEEFREQFERAVTRRLVADVPLGAFLSGGIDATAIVTAMCRARQSEIRTFTVGFDAEPGDETVQASKTAERLGTTHQNLIIASESVPGLIPEAIDAMDIPSADAINTWLVSRATREAGITVALSGIGGDELFGGYPSAELAQNPWLHRPLLAGLAALVSQTRAAAHLPLKIRKLLMMLEYGGAHGSVAGSRVVFDHVMLKQLGLKGNGGFIHSQTKFQGNSSNANAFYEFEYYCKRLLIADTDQMSMAHALEVRAPFLDIDFLAAAARLNAFPPKREIAHRKWRFIQMLPGYFPDELISSPKKGFILPMDSWLRGPLRNYLEAGLFESPLTSMLDKSRIERFYGQFTRQTGEVSWSRIWLLSVLGHWMRKNGVCW